MNGPEAVSISVVAAQLIEVFHQYLEKERMWN
jgi:hypothetical protein